ncbi:hypothetical protein G5714_021446 [Onychostoma macrolepis]|uniref:Uncharacterized protein n=1 Tax=Onychostoma macrolepis TaxID=369639 RepID=A0A7J6BR60_9TELE|nr:hypothetical protein G5714_021446 [Onychostoma macrolepis]
MFGLTDFAAKMSEEEGKDSLSEMSLSEEQSVRSGSRVFSSVSVKSEGPNFSEKKPSVRSGSRVFSSVSVKSEGPNFSERKPSSTKSDKGQKTTVNIGAEFTRWQTLKAQKGMKSDVELASFLLNR